ncbi:MAG: Cof-type HAD-IIB family hydrolase [Lachnospiraceae bacterium]|nr:Cof-type HAD-IIB family hydrolase [Lachnospiraceae bacterium]
MYKLIAVDMDGTLLKSDKTLHPDTVTDIEYASSKGTEVVYCSGRAVIEIRPYLESLPSIRYGICCSGSVVYDFKEDKVVFSKEIMAKYAVIISDTAKKYDGMTHFLAVDSTADKSQVTHMDDYNMGVYQPLFEAIAKKVPDMSEEAKTRIAIPKVNIYFRTHADREAAFEELKDLPLCFATVGDTILEMTAPGVSKALGLRILANRLGIDLKNTVGIGDSDNDREMLGIAGFPVAMGNAEAEILSMCKMTTDDNDHNGVGKAIRKLC